MKRTTIMLPAELKHRAKWLAREEGRSLGELVRESLEKRLAQDTRGHDPFFSDTAVFEGDVPSDLSINHDNYLYDEKDE
jgi:hypothetical protein